MLTKEIINRKERKMKKMESLRRNVNRRNENEIKFKRTNERRQLLIFGDHRYLACAF